MFPIPVRGFLISSLFLYVSAFESGKLWALLGRVGGWNSGEGKDAGVLESVFCAPRCLMRNDAAGTITSFLFCLNSTPFPYCRSLNSSKRHAEDILLLEVWQHMYVYRGLCFSGLILKSSCIYSARDYRKQYSRLSRRSSPRTTLSAYSNLPIL